MPLLETFFERWPTPEAARDADETDVMDLLRPLGLAERRSHCIIRFSGGRPAGKLRPHLELL